MGALKEKMIMDLELRNYSTRTIEAYVQNMTEFVRMFGKRPDELGQTEIRQFLHHLRKQKKSSTSKINVAYCALTAVVKCAFLTTRAATVIAPSVSF